MIDVLHDFVGLAMVVAGAYGLGWYWRRPPVFGRVRGVAGKRCDNA